jgi:DNA-directed RNA polymerase subunit RPC12/RpoP
MSEPLIFTLVGIVAIAALVVLVRVRSGNTGRGNRRAAAAAAVDDYRRKRDKADLGLMCPVCRAIAEPISDTRDRYRCVGCGHEFGADLHEWKME